MVKSLRSAVVVACALGAMAVGTLSASAAASARWEMNEAPGTTTMTDTGGMGLNGSIGSDVLTGIKVGSATVYRFPFVQGLGSAYRPQRLITVPDNAYLDVTGSQYALTVRLKTKQTWVNITQKGQSGNPGGYWKLELDDGYPNCLFRGPNGSLTVTSTVRVSDGAWHTVTCQHSSQGLQVIVDGTAGKLRVGTTGPINNSRPVNIGGKSSCDGVTTSCDYYSGDIDWVSIVKS
jgi:hypothetical protein